MKRRVRLTTRQLKPKDAILKHHANKAACTLPVTFHPNLHANPMEIRGNK
jgi:hypothetical protein